MYDDAAFGLSKTDRVARAIQAARAKGVSESVLSLPPDQRFPGWPMVSGGVGLVTDISTNSLKTSYPPKAVETMIQEDLVFRPKLKRSLPPGARLSDGYAINFGARLSPAQNVAQILDGGNFPIPKDATDRQFIFKPTMFAATYQIGLMTMHVAASNVAGFNGGEVQRRPEETMSNFGKFIESTYVGTAGDGIRGYVESEPSDAVIKVKNPWGTRLLAENHYISVRIAAGSTVRDNIDLAQITDVDDDNRQFTHSITGKTPVADDPIYVVAETAQTLSGLFANGLRGQVDDGTNAQYIHTLDRTAAGNRKLKSVVDSFGGERRPFTDSLLNRVTTKTGRRSPKKPSTLLMGEGMAVAYAEAFNVQRRNPATGRGRSSKSGGFAVEDLGYIGPYGTMEFMLSPDALPTEVHGLSWDAMFFYSALDAQWLSGNEMQKLLLLTGSNGSPYKAAFGAHLASIENWGTDMPLAHFVIRDLKDHLVGD